MTTKWYQEFFSGDWANKIEASEIETGVLDLHNNGPLTLVQSKVGGVGYFPKDEPYPYGKSGKPLSFLAQLNFSELPPIQNFPSSGIVAFYIDLADDLLGLNLEDMRNQGGYRVYYFEDISREAYSREELEQLDQPEYPIAKGEYAISCTVQKRPLLDDNYEVIQQYGKEFYYLMEDIFGDEVDDQLDAIHSVMTEETGAGFIGGYPSFTQEDPRKYKEELREDRLLFQLNSVYDEDIDILWGDSGIGQFFIHPEHLQQKRFDRAWYNWDCY